MANWNPRKLPGQVSSSCTPRVPVSGSDSRPGHRPRAPTALPARPRREGAGQEGAPGAHSPRLMGLRPTGAAVGSAVYILFSVRAGGNPSGRDPSRRTTALSGTCLCDWVAFRAPVVPHPGLHNHCLILAFRPCRGQWRFVTGVIGQFQAHSDSPSSPVGSGLGRSRCVCLGGRVTKSVHQSVGLLCLR